MHPGRTAAVAAWIERAFLPLVVLGALIGFAAPAAPRAIDDHHGIELALVVLVFASASTIDLSDLARLRVVVPRLLAAAVAAMIVLPALAYGVSRLFGSPDIRHAVLAVGVAPAEVATIGIAAMAGAEAAVASLLLVVSTVTSVALAGPLLAVMGGRGVSTVGVLVDLSWVVAAPFVVGLLAGRIVRRLGGKLVGLELCSAVAVLVLVWLVSGQAHLSASYVGVAAGFVTLIGLSAAIGAALACGLATEVRRSVLLSLSMRDFAIASGIATSAFGARAAGPLGLYGVLVLTWGAVVARVSGRAGG